MGWRLNTDTPEGGIESVLVAYADDELMRGYVLAGDLYKGSPAFGRSLFTAGLGGILKKEMIVAKQITLNVERFLVCSTGEEIEIPEPADSLEAAIELCNIRNAADENEVWEIMAEVAA